MYWKEQSTYQICFSCYRRCISSSTTGLWLAKRRLCKHNFLTQTTKGNSDAVNKLHVHHPTNEGIWIQNTLQFYTYLPTAAALTSCGTTNTIPLCPAKHAPFQTIEERCWSATTRMTFLLQRKELWGISVERTKTGCVSVVIDDVWFTGWVILDGVIQYVGRWHRIRSVIYEMWLQQMWDYGGIFFP